ncbi:DUF58 domain-containing protein [Lysobacter pythonis]|uniref:DUF58 domain-containing protein n=1 Tax=Solilutibacter pythonis TaxID=2483112 RepID=A0A3M2HMA9_9GAMM|nr:DUF58 domain-containing protein [Lysobacter pythonis]RMH90851.1 DUF58 domain-containing protein [Lysobacter pythonis]
MAAIARLARPRAGESLPVVLGRRRIYVLPTRFGLFFLLLIGTMCVGALNYNNNPALLLALLLAGAGIASLLAAHLQLSGLRAEAIAAEPVAAGEPMPLRLSFASRDERPRDGLQLAIGQSHAVFSLPAHGGGIAEIRLPTERRGWLEIERIEIATTRPLGLARAWAWLRPELLLLVYPTPETDGPPLPESMQDGEHRRPHFTGDDLHLLRNYQPGDALRSIAWKASARREQLMSRTWEASHGDDIELDWHAVRLPHEARIRRLAHWIDLADREGRRWRLALPLQAPLGPGSGPAHRHECLRALALMPEGADA